MPKTIKYSELMKKLDKIIHLSIKNIDTIILDKSNYELDEKRNQLNLKNIIIDRDLIRYKQYIRIIETKAENIYFNNYENIGGITIPYDVIINDDTELKIIRDNESNIKKLNIILNDNTIKNIEIKECFNEIIINKSDKNLIVNIYSPEEELKYIIDELGNINEEKSKYYIGEKDIKIENDKKILDLRSYVHYKNIEFSNLKINTLIINKFFIENIDKINLDTILAFSPENKFDTLKIIDDNDMKLIPIEKTFNNITKIMFRKHNTNYIYLEDNSNNKIVIYIDKNNNIKTIEYNELIKDKSVSNILFRFKNEYLIFINRNINLILIKYKNGKYKVIDFDNEYELNKLFSKQLSINGDKYFLKTKNIEALKNNDLETIFLDEDFSNGIFYEMYNDYIEYKNYIEKLKELGFANNAIKYLFERKFFNIIDIKNKDLIDLNSLTETEINGFNKIGEEYIKGKKLKK